MVQSWVKIWGIGLVSWCLGASGVRFEPGRVIVKLKQKPEGANAPMTLSGVKELEPLVPELNLYLAHLQTEASVIDSVTRFKGAEGVVYAQPDHLVTRRNLPNDVDFEKQWSLKNKEATDINAEQAWKVSTGSEEYVVAIIDGGIDIEHPELIPNLWINQGEIPDNDKDDDGNGYVDDVYGWNAFNDTGEIYPDTHGTHVAGIVGARGDNEKFVTGVNWNVKLMAVQGSSNNTSTVLKAYGYVLRQKELYLETNGKKGANIVATNSSFGIDYANCEEKDYPSWNEMYDALGKVGILSAAATPNLDLNVDEEGDVPTGCTSDYLIAVTNVQKDGLKFEDAGFGKKSVDLAAPGTGILSTIPRNRVAELTGTSMATPHVAGSIALLHSAASGKFHNLRDRDPAQAAKILKKSLLSTVDKVDKLEAVSGGRLNIGKAAEWVSRY